MSNIEIAERKEIIMQQLMHSFFYKELPPDGRLPSAQQLALQYGVSIVTMREILKSMEAIGVLSVSHGRGIFLNNPDTILEELFDTRILVECYCAQIAATRGTDQELTELALIMDDFVAAATSKDIERYAETDYLFHLKISQMSRNRILETTLRNIRVFLHYQLLETNKKLLPSLHESVEKHRHICAALMARDGVSAAAAMREHLVITRRLWKQ